MSLFGSIQMAGNTLQANEIALQVVGQNIANANTPGYLREDVILAPGPAQKWGNLLLGTGVSIKAVVQNVDAFLEERLRGAVGENGAAGVLQQTYAQLEGIVGELSDTDLSTSMNKFFASISEVLNQPEDVSVRNLAVLQGDTLAKDINRMASRTNEVRADLNNRVQNMTTDINRLIEDIRLMNVRIADAEGGNTSQSDAVGLRDQRMQDLEDLSKLIDIRTTEQPSGAVTVYVGGDFLVYEGTARSVKAVLERDRGLTVANLRISQTDAALNPASGQLRGMLDARDKVLGGFLDQLDDFAGTLAYEFNKVYSSGQGLRGFDQMTATNAVDDSEQPLDAAGLKFAPQNGSFQVLVRNKKTGLTRTTDINVDLNGVDQDMTLNDLKTAISSVVSADGTNPLAADITPGRQLTIQSLSSDLEFTFANDTSGVLAALGLNTFFTGSGARDLGINADVRRDPAKFAASAGGVGADTEIAAQLAQFLDRPLDSHGGDSLGLIYNQLTARVTQESTIAKAGADGAQTFETTLRGQKLATSGVNIDEEAVRMLQYQRAFQATAKYIATLNDLFGVLVNI